MWVFLAWRWTNDIYYCTLYNVIFLVKHGLVLFLWHAHILDCYGIFSTIDGFSFFLFCNLFKPGEWYGLWGGFQAMLFFYGVLLFRIWWWTLGMFIKVLVSWLCQRQRQRKRNKEIHREICMCKCFCSLQFSCSL